jgi:hypothetical protein
MHLINVVLWQMPGDKTRRSMRLYDELHCLESNSLAANRGMRVFPRKDLSGIKIANFRFDRVFHFMHLKEAMGEA